MKQILFLLSSLFLYCMTGAQNLQKIASDIEAEGKALYRSEKASWLGTDLFMEKYSNLADQIGGYISYSDDKQTYCVFISNQKKAMVLATFTFDHSFTRSGTRIDANPREITDTEKELLLLREKAEAAISKDTLFKMYRNTSYNLVPFIYEGHKKVYILTGPKNAGVVIFGNDYELTFDNKNRLKSTRRIHRNIIVQEYGDEAEKAAAPDSASESVGAIHTHLPETGEFITPTDICTLMLYQEFTGWKQYVVVSEKHCSFWNCRTNSLVIVPTDVMNKIHQQQEDKK